MYFSLSGLNPLSFDAASGSKALQLGSAVPPLGLESSSENGSDPGKKRKRANVPAGEQGSGHGEVAMEAEIEQPHICVMSVAPPGLPDHSARF